MKIRKSLATMLFLSLGLGVNASAVTLLKLAHDKPRAHPASKALAYFAQQVRLLSKNSIEIKIYPESQLINQSQVLPLLAEGKEVDMALTDTHEMAKHVDEYMVFNMPFLFSDKEKLDKAIHTKTALTLLTSTEKEGYVGLQYYVAGSRSFYANKALAKIEDFAGVKIAVPDTYIDREIVTLLGGEPVAMPYDKRSDALRNKAADGAEYNIMALTLGDHGKYVKYFANDEHSISPNIVLISNKSWAALSADNKTIITKALADSANKVKLYWDEFESAQVAKIKSLGIEIGTPDVSIFQQKLEPLYESVKTKYPVVYKDILEFKAL